MKNTLGDLNNHLFEQMERLNDDELNGEELENELNRTKGMATLSSNIINNANLILRATELNVEHSRANVPNILIGNKDEK